MDKQRFIGGYISPAGGNIVTITGAQLSTASPPVYDATANTWEITITGGVFPEITGTERCFYK